ncbi:hypothetical protein V8E54_001969 [Elaphomyces granulatus]
MHIYSAIFAALLLLPPTLADFHIGEQFGIVGSGDDPPTITKYIACPSNYYNCNCFGSLKSERGVFIPGGDNPGSATFSLNPGLCGMGKLDFYYQADKGVWDFYISDGNGEVQGTCYRNSAAKQYCGFPPFYKFQYTDSLVCYSYICK